jgi:sporulation protein YunB
MMPFRRRLVRRGSIGFTFRHLFKQGLPRFRSRTFSPKGHDYHLRMIKPRLNYKIKWFLLFFIFCILFILLMWMVESTLKPTLLVIAKTEAKNNAQAAFLKGIEEIQSTLKEDFSKVAYLHKDKQGHIVGISFDGQAEGMIYKVVAQKIQAQLSQSQYRRAQIPLGKILNSSLLSDYGPRIPLNIWMEGSPHITLLSNVESKGINTTMIHILIHANIQLATLMPFNEEHFPVEFDYPIVRELVVGDVPNFYPFPQNNNANAAPLFPPK